MVQSVSKPLLGTAEQVFEVFTTPPIPVSAYIVLMPVQVNFPSRTEGHSVPKKKVGGNPADLFRKEHKLLSMGKILLRRPAYPPGLGIIHLNWGLESTEKAPLYHLHSHLVGKEMNKSMFVHRTCA